MVSIAGLPPGIVESPSGWDLAEVARSNYPRHIDGLSSAFAGLGCCAYPEPPSEAVVLPITPSSWDRPAAILVAGVSSRLRLNQAYRSFYHSLASTLTALFAGAGASEAEKNSAEALSRSTVPKQSWFPTSVMNCALRSHSFWDPSRRSWPSVTTFCPRPGGIAWERRTAIVCACSGW